LDYESEIPLIIERLRVTIEERDNTIATLRNTQNELNVIQTKLTETEGTNILYKLKCLILILIQTLNCSNFKRGRFSKRQSFA